MSSRCAQLNHKHKPINVCLLHPWTHLTMCSIRSIHWPCKKVRRPRPGSHSVYWTCSPNGIQNTSPSPSSPRSTPTDSSLSPDCRDLRSLIRDLSWWKCCPLLTNVGLERDWLLRDWLTGPRSIYSRPNVRSERWVLHIPWSMSKPRPWEVKKFRNSSQKTRRSLHDFF